MNVGYAHASANGDPMPKRLAGILDEYHASMEYRRRGQPPRHRSPIVISRDRDWSSDAARTPVPRQHEGIHPWRRRRRRRDPPRGRHDRQHPIGISNPSTSTISTPRPRQGQDRRGQRVRRAGRDHRHPRRQLQQPQRVQADDVRHLSRPVHRRIGTDAEPCACATRLQTYDKGLYLEFDRDAHCAATPSHSSRRSSPPPADRS